jgi:hypothetical protein
MFLLSSAIDYQRKDDPVERIETFVSHLSTSDAEDLWGYIARKGDSDYLGWLNECEQFHLDRHIPHRETLYRMAKKLTRWFNGDARQLWEGNPTPMQVIELLEDRLGLSEELAHMTAGALADVEIIEGRGPLKADTHVRRTLGRILLGTKLTAKEANAAAAWLNPDNPWTLDRSLYTLGSEVCPARGPPECDSCYMKEVCRYANEQGGTSIAPSKSPEYGSTAR